ncbi:MAG: S26 family signal peptidase [Methanomassiliicoccales archaeon]|nr:S26 family signal peptidase [Methanomassiliicoccales archaeon]
MSVSEAAKKVIGIIKSLRGFIIAAAIVLIIIGALVLYSGAWPPLVVIESKSMQHSQTESFIGVIDTGDMVILKRVSGIAEVRPYLDSLADGYQTYGEYGDVVIYKPGGSDSRTPIIHRALLRLYYNDSGGGFDIPVLGEIPSTMWSVVGGPKDWHNMKSGLVLTGIGYNHVSVRLNLSTILSYFDQVNMTPFGGLVTLGDNNRGIADQSTDISRTPVREDWIDGVARGELPWFGLLKLWITGPAPDGTVPENSKTGLFVSLGLLIGGPIALDLTSIFLERKGKHPGAWLKRKLGFGEKIEAAKAEPVPEDEPAGAQGKKTKKSPSAEKRRSASQKKPKKGK